MTDIQANQLLEELIYLPRETEWLEFKKNSGSVNNDEIGEYLSALSNGACIKNEPFGYLIWGIENETHKRIGTNFTFFTAKQGNQDLELWLKTLLQPKINFHIHEFDVNGYHFILLQIPAASGEPVYFKSKSYIRINSQKTELTKYPDLVRQIYNSHLDWSAGIIENAKMTDLDLKAVQFARKKYIERNPNLKEQINTWSDSVFLDKIKITIHGKLTRTALLLLGKNESSSYLLPYTPEILWKLDSDEKAYEYFGLPFIFNTSKVADKIRNYKYKFFPDTELFSTTVDKYDHKVILEALYNCVAHQDYQANSRIILTEQKDKLIFYNSGGFFEGQPEDYSLGKLTPKKYRNKWLVDVMVNLNMIDALGYGIHTMFMEQSKRFFPLPQYNLQKPNEVTLTIFGHSIDENYSKLLLKNSNFSLSTIILLDRIQKGLEIPKKEIGFLKKEGLITGRKPNYFLVENLPEKPEKMAQYIKNKGFDKEYYKKLIVEYVTKTRTGATKADIRNLLWDKLPDVLTHPQKSVKISNLIAELRKSDFIINTGSLTNPCWKIKE